MSLPPLVSAWPFGFGLNAVGEISPDTIHGRPHTNTKREKSGDENNEKTEGREREGERDGGDSALGPLSLSLSPLSPLSLFVALRGSPKCLFDAFYGVV